MDFFKSDFYKSSLNVLQNVQKTKLFDIKFPELKYLTSGDQIYQQLWKMIDEANSYIWLITYTLDNSFSANLTMNKLIDAQKRGVNVMVMIDDLNNWINASLRSELIKNGGLVYTLNQIGPLVLNKEFDRELFRRHHEKLIIADDTTMLGSSNITDEYGAYIYGTYDFLDMNVIMKNLILSQSRNFFYNIAQLYGLKLHRTKSNDEILADYEKKYKDSIYDLNNIRLLKTAPTDINEIQAFVLEQIKKSRSKILMVQPYWWPMKEVDDQLISALKRGVEVEIITAGKRDQPAYAKLSNGILMKNLIQNGAKVYETYDKLLHMKIYHFDSKIMTLGSFNNDYWSWLLNNELNLVIEGEEEASKVEKLIYEVKEKTKRADPFINVTWKHYLQMRFWIWWVETSEIVMNKRKIHKILFNPDLNTQDSNITNLKTRLHKIYNTWDDAFGTFF